MQAINQIDWYLHRTFTKDLMICVLDENQEKLAGGQSKDLIIYVLDENQEKQRGGVCLPPEKKLKQKLVCLFLFWGRSFKLAKFHWNQLYGMCHDCLVLLWT